MHLTEKMYLQRNLKNKKSLYLQVPVHDSPGVNVLHSFKYVSQQAECGFRINTFIRT